MAKKLNKVFLNPTAEQIAEYQLIEGISWFTDMDLLAAAIEEDQKKKASERIYSLNQFQIVDGARQITANLSKIAKQTGYTLSNDLLKVIDWAKTEIDYDVDTTIDHRVASTAADGKAELSNQARVNATTPIDRDAYAATAAGQALYDAAVEAQVKAYDDANAPADTKIIGYKDLTLTNIGSKATAEEEGETFDEKKTVVTQYATTDVKGGDFSFDYQKDSVKTLDKKDAFLLTESGKTNVKISAAAAGTLTVTNSVINSIDSSFTESANAIKGLHFDNDVNALVAETLEAGGYETVVIDNTTVGGNIKGGSISIEKTGTFTKETFLDKEAESGTYYNSVTASDEPAAISNNNKLYIHVSGTSALTSEEVTKLQEKGLSVVEDAVQANLSVNKYQVLTSDVNGNPIETGKFVYITADEYANLSGTVLPPTGNKAALSLVTADYGYVDYSSDRVVTDANFLTYDQAPAGVATGKTKVNKYVYKNAMEQKATYYLTAAEEAALNATITAEYPTYLPGESDVAALGDEKYRRVAEAVNTTTYKADAKAAYHTISDSYKQYVISSTMSEEAALELNKTDMAAGFVWVKQAGASDDKKLFRMSQFTKDGSGNSVETQYYLTASEMSAMDFFGVGVVKTYDQVKDTVDPDFITKDGWAFSGNVVGADRVYTDMYRDGAAATTATLSNYTVDKTEVVTDVEPFAYVRNEITYTTAAAGADLLKTVALVGQFNELIANNLVGSNSEYVTVIDGQAVDMYQTYGYAATVTDPSTVVAGKLSSNAAEIVYSAVVQEALWEGDATIGLKNATLVDGIKTQNTKKYFDQYFDADGEYVAGTAEEQKTGEKKHEFITVAEKRNRGDNWTITAGEVVTEVRAKVDDGTGTFVDAYYAADGLGTLTKDSQDATANNAIFYYRGADTKMYALTEAEATAAVALLEGGVATKLYYYTTANANGWYVDDATAKAAIGDTAVKMTMPGYRDYSVVGITAGDISNGEYNTLTQDGMLKATQHNALEKAYVTEEIQYTPTAEDNKDRIQIDGKDAYYEKVSGTLVTNKTTTYDAIYEYTLNATPGGASVDGLSYYMTEAEAAKVQKGPGYVATAVFEKVAPGNPITDLGGDSLYRISNAVEIDKSAYLTYDEKKTISNAGTAATYVLDNEEAYNKIRYVIGKQVYKYTLEGDAATYYLTEDEATTIADTWGGALVKGDKSEGAVHYGTAASYAPAQKANFTKAGTVYYYTPDYTGWSITQDAEGKATQAFNADGAIWSNIDGVQWTVDAVLTTFSNTAFEMCDNTYFYNYDDDYDWSAEQIAKISAAEEAAGIATWKVEEINSQIVWTRTTAIGEVSTYIMNHEGVETAYNRKSTDSHEATGAIAVVNGSEVRGTISGYKDVIVSDSTVDDVEGGNSQEVTTRTLATSKGSVGKDGTQTITTKETRNTTQSETAAGSFTVTRSESDKIYVAADDVTGYETVVVSGVNTDDLIAADTVSGSNFSQTISRNAQISYQGDPDALRSNYIDNWDDLAFTKGIVSKVTAENETTKTTESTTGSLTATGRDYKYVPGEGQQDKSNTLGNIAGYKTVTLTNINAGNIEAVDRAEDVQTTYKVATKNNVDTATETRKTKNDDKAVAELTAINTVTNPQVEADLDLGNISGFATVSTVNYSFVDANALGEVSTTRSTSSAREAVASDMRLLNAGVNKNTGLVNPANATQKYSYAGEPTAITATSYKQNGTSYSASTTTKRTANGTLTSVGRSYAEVTENYTNKQGVVDKDPVYAYTQTASGRTYYLTETQFEAILSDSKADAAQWTKGSEVVYYRNSNDAVTNYAGTVTGAQAVYKCMNGGETITLYLTEGELANYNVVNSGDKLTKSGDASLRKDNDAKAVFGYSFAQINTASGFVGTVAGVYQYTKAGEADQYVTDAEAAALGEGWTKNPGTEYVRKANAGDDRTLASVIDKATMTGDLKVYVNKYDSSDLFVVTAEEEAFLLDVAAEMENYALADTKGYRVTAKNAALTANTGAVSAASGWTFVETHSYVKVNAFDEVTNQAYVTDADFALMSKTGKDLDGYIKDDGSHKNAPNTALTKYQVREASLVVTEDTTYATITGNSQDVAPAELIGLKLTDEQAAAANLYTVGAYTGKKSEFVLAPVTEDPLEGNTTFGNIYGYKTVSLSGMNGGDIIRVANAGFVDADNDTTSTTYKKTSKKGKDGAVTYTENDTMKVTQTYTADGSVLLVDSQVGNIAGYKTVTATPVAGTVQVGTISRTTDDPNGSLDKWTQDQKTKTVTEDSAATFKVTTSQQNKTTETRTASGSVELVGNRAGKEIDIDKSVLYDTAAEAVEAAQAAIDEYGDKQFADIVITGGVIGYQDVTVTNASITAAGVSFVGGKFAENNSTDHTTVSITDNGADNVSVINKINDSSNRTQTAAGSLTMTNVNYAGAYTAASETVAATVPVVQYDPEVYTLVNEYIFNGKTYALTADEAEALLEYGALKPKSSTPGDFYVDAFRKNETITTPAIELTGTMQDVVNAKGVDGDTYAQDTVYFAAKAKEGDLYIRADQVNALIAGTVPGYTEATVDTSVKHYAQGGVAAQSYTKAAWEDGAHEQTANVKKYVVTEDGESTTYYLTDAEASVLKNIEGKDVVAGSDTKAYTRMASIPAPAVTVNALAIGAKQDAATEVFEYRGVKKDVGNTGESLSFYLTADEAAICFADQDVYGNFGKVGTKTYTRYTPTPITAGNFEANATIANVYTEVKDYEKGGAHVYLTDAEAALIKDIDGTYDGYNKVGDTKYYRAAASAFNVVNKATLDAQFTSVDESIEVFEVQNLSGETVAYLSRAELLALRTAWADSGSNFDTYYNVFDNPLDTTYLRAADDTTDIIKINPFEGGYVVAQGADLPFAQYAAAVNEAVPASKADASGFQTVTLTNADMRDITGGNSTRKTSEKLAAKKTSSIATYTTTLDETATATGSLTATDSAVRDITGYDKVSLTATEMDKVNNSARDITGGKSTNNVKTVYTSLVQGAKADYILNALEWTETTKETATATGSAELKNVVAGDIEGYKDVTVSFDKAIDTADKTKNQIGGISGGNYLKNEIEQFSTLKAGADSYSEVVTKETYTSVGTVTLDKVYAFGDVANFVTATITDSEITGNLSAGNVVVDTTEKDVGGLGASSTAIVNTVTAAGTALVTSSTINGDVAQFKDVVLAGGVEIGGDIIVGGDDVETVKRSNKAIENTACYAVFFNDGAKKVVYLTEAEYKVFVQEETSAVIDMTVAVYREQEARTDAQLKQPGVVATLKTFTAYTDDPVTDVGAGQQGRDTTTYIVKTAGNSVIIDDKGAKVDGKVQGYATVSVFGDSSFRGGYFGTAKNDKLELEANLATFTPVPPAGKNPVGFDFGEGKDELVLTDATIGIQAAFKFNPVEGTNAWNLETISGSGTIVCRTEDVEDVKTAFEGIKVVGSDNYNAVNALDHQEYDDALNVGDTDPIADWLGFCNKSDYFANGTLANKIFSFEGESVTSGDIVAQISVDGGATYQTLKNGDTVQDGAMVRISQLSSSTKASNDYVIAFK